MDVKNDLRQYIALLLHWAWLLILAAALAGAAAYFISSRQQPIYQATTTILIDEAPGTQQGNDYQSILSSERRARTYAQLLTTSPLLEAVIDELKLPYSTERLRDALSVQSVRDTQLIKLQVRDSDPQRAAQVANTLVQQFAAQTQQLQNARYGASKANLQEQIAQLEAQIQQTETQLARLGQTASERATRERLETTLAQLRQSQANLLQSYEQVRLAEAATTSSIVAVEPAQAPSEPVAPRVLLNTLLAAFVGLLLALGLVFLKETLDDSVKHPDQLKQAFDLPILALLPHSPTNQGHRPIVVEQPRAPVAEAFRTLRTNIEFAGVDRPLRSLLVTSPAPGDGKTHVALNLAAIIAQAGREVALVDADLRRPALHQRLALSNRDGLSELFIQPQPHLNGSLRKTEIPGVSAITAGKLPPNPAELLGSERLGTIFAQVRTRVDLIVLDAPPVIAVTDAVVLAPRVDGVLLVVRVGRTRMGALRQTLEQLQRAGAHVVGIVLNDAPLGRSRYGYIYQHYYQAYQYAQHNRSGKGGLFRRRKSQAERVEH